VQHKYFRKRDIRIFCHNFQTYARSHDLEDKVSGYRQRQGKKLLHYFYHQIVAYPPPSPFPRFKISENKGHDSDNDEVEDDNDENNDNMTKAVALKTKAPSKKRGGQDNGEGSN
jgi:hypothetical protein